MNPTYNGYKAFYNGKTLEVYSGTSLDARNQAATVWKCQLKSNT